MPTLEFLTYTKLSFCELFVTLDMFLYRKLFQGIHLL
jgi:hypothetical protein